MISNQTLQSTIEGLKAIARVEFCIMDTEGKEVASTGNISVNGGAVAEFAKSPADSQEIQGCQYFKIYDEQQLEYVMVTAGTGEDVYTIGKMAAFQVQNLMVAYKERFDKDNFIKNLLLDNLLLVDIYNRSKKLHIDTDVRRIVLLIEVNNERDMNSLETVRSIYTGRPKDFITAVDEKNIIVVKELSDKDGNKELEKMALEAVADRLGGKEPRKVIVKAPKIVSIVPAE